MTPTEELVQRIVSGVHFIGNAGTTVAGWRVDMASVDRDQFHAALEVIKQRATCAMLWQDARVVEPDDRKWYLVITNGAQDRENDKFVWPGLMLRHALEPQIIRGRPLWVAEITEPKS